MFQPLFYFLIQVFSYCATRSMKLNAFPSPQHLFDPHSESPGKMAEALHIHSHSWQLGSWTHNHANQCFLHKTFSTTPEPKAPVDTTRFLFQLKSYNQAALCFFTLMHYDGYLGCAQQSPRICFSNPCLPPTQQCC